MISGVPSADNTAAWASARAASVIRLSSPHSSESNRNRFAQLGAVGSAGPVTLVQGASVGALSVPPGWTAVYGDEDHPGSLVRVRSARDPEPAFRGYARAMHDKISSR